MKVAGTTLTDGIDEHRFDDLKQAWVTSAGSDLAALVKPV